ncbi:uncharacterized protein BHQ10_000973 [Talaromyces amestolkiae]|uniref:Uncharacterized protein n=1 Tax=Talaromyces amestolkiae TaxID=1196081 RepID=A0A364KN68_TALAM|nr:uncharacterized protein BHQ10_000973 [Talaromyces amestolkiae]RAO64961.1 hypothetical protein BHQ10_000973 [Talaromyces amestolkiae]
MAIAVEQVDTRWPYRAGYPRLLRPEIINADDEEEASPIYKSEYKELESRIDTIIGTYNIPKGSHPPEVCLRAQKFGMSKLWRVLVDCTYEKGKSDSKMWAKAVTEIHTAAKEVAKEGREVGVELCDRAFERSSHICTPPDSSSLEANWDVGRDYCHQILQLFENRPTMFQIMTPVGRCSRGWHEYEWTTVVLFEAIDAEDVAWDFLEERMRALLPDDIGIEIRQRANPLFCFDGAPGIIAYRQLDLKAYVRPPKPGCEFSQHNQNTRAGTMGGYIVTEAADTKMRTTFGVTNAHVALGSYKEMSLNTSADYDINFQSPSGSRRIKHETVLLNEIAKAESRIQTQHEIIESIQEQDPVLFQRLGKSLSINQANLAFLKKDLQLVQSDLHIGSVYKVKLGHSEYKTTAGQTERLVMDLALLKIKPDCLAHEKPHEIHWKENFEDPIIEKDTTCHFWEVDSLGEHIKVVSRLSRSGSYTMGTVSNFQAYCVEHEEEGRSGEFKGFAWVITCPRRHGNPDEPDARRPFAAPGDSGSFVIAAADWKYDGKENKITMLPSREAAVTNDPSQHPFTVGLLFGASDSSDIALFIPFDAVKSEIESMTGEKLVWPQKRTASLKEAKASLPSWMKDGQDNLCG